MNWDTTPAYRQSAARTLGDLPLILDETRLARSNDEIVQTVYSTVGGRGRGRGCGSRGGTQQRDSCATVLITSGETPITSMTNKGGARARTFSLWGSPFGQTDETTAALVGRLNRELAANYGFAGPALVRHLTRYRGMWDTWREAYLARVAELEGRANGDPVACRMVAPLAAISITARLAHEAMDHPPWPHVDVVAALWDELTVESADCATAALGYAMEWAVANRSRFYCGDGQARGRAAGSWYGRWDQNGDWIGFLERPLEKELTGRGLEFEPTVRVWRDRGWLLRDNHSRKARLRTRIDGELCWVIAIPWPIITANTGLR